MDLEDQLKEALKVDVPPELKLSMRERIMNEARLSQGRKQVVAAPRRRWHLPFLPKPVRLHPVAFASVVFLSVFAGTAAASGSASPDSLLYPVRQKIEDARISLVRSDVDRAQAELELADQRLTEVSDMLREGKDAYVPDLLARYETNMSQAISLRDQAARDDRDVSEIDALAAAIAVRHDEILSSAPLSEAMGNGSAGLYSNEDADGAGAGPAAARPHAGNSSASVGGGTMASTPAAQPAAPGAGAAASGNPNNPPDVADNQGADAADIEPEEEDSAGNGSDNDSSDRSRSASRRADRTAVADVGSSDAPSKQKHRDSAKRKTDKRRGGASLAARND
jgi:hypothetical protein